MKGYRILFHATLAGFLMLTISKLLTSAELIQIVQGPGGIEIPIPYHPEPTEEPEPAPPMAPVRVVNASARGRGFGRSFSSGENAAENSKENDGGASQMGILRSAQKTDASGEFFAEPNATDAKHGDACVPTPINTWDYCELARYPNKGRMVCATPDLDPENPNTCICKFGKAIDNTNASSIKYVQLRLDPRTGVCLSPEGGICYVKFPKEKPHSSDKKPIEYLTDQLDGKPIYEKNLTKATDQCDNINNTYSEKSETYLNCSQAHPRRFSVFNAYSYYCLSKNNRPEEEEPHDKKGKASLTISLGMEFEIAISLAVILLNRLN